MERIGRFVLFREVDSTPWARLYRSFMVKDDARTRVYLRVFPFGFQENLSFQSHISLNEVLAVETLDNKGLFAEEYFPGATIHSIIKRCRDESFPLPADHCLHILERVLAAFEEHKYAFPHPHLVYLSFDGEVKGSSVPLGLPLSGGQPDSLLPYLSPQFLETKSWTRQDQVYAAGAFFFEMMTGKVLPGVGTEEDRLKMITVTPTMEDQPIPRDLQMILLKALAQKTDERYANLKEMREEGGKLIYDGTYAPTTFNVAFFMHTYFRDEINNEEKICLDEDQTDFKSLFEPPQIKTAEEEKKSVETGSPLPLRQPTMQKKRSPVPFVAALAIVVILIVVAIFFPWPSKKSNETTSSPAQPSPQLQEQIARQKEEIDRLKQLEEDRQAELDRLRKEASSRKNPEIEKQIQQKEREYQEAKNAIQKAEQNIPASPKPVSKPEKVIPQSTGESDQKAGLPDQPEAKPDSGGTAVDSAETPVEEISPPSAEKEEPEPAKERTSEPSVQKGQYVAPEEVDMMPIAIHTVKPEYPPLALRKRIQGKVFLKVLIDEAGMPGEISVIRAPGGKIGLDKAASDAVKQWKFQPALKDGIPVKTHKVIVIPFVL